MDVSSNRRVSVALATFNGDRFLRAQLDSLAGQSLQPLEVVITDDGSSDETIEIAEAFKRQAPFDVLVFKNPDRLGFQRNFMRAASLCRGDYIAFCDQDDLWNPEKLELMVGELQKTGALLCHHVARLVDTEGRPWGVTAKPGFFPEYTDAMEGNPWKFAMGFTQVFDARLAKYQDLFLETAAFSEDGKPLSHDLWIAFLASSLGSVCYLDRMLVDYRQHGGNVYGFENKSKISLYENLRRFFSRRAEQFSTMGRFCENYSGLLTRIALQESEPSMAREARKAAGLYAELGELYKVRNLCYYARGGLGRLKAFVKLNRMGGYRASPNWTFGGSGFLRDLILGVVGAPVVLRFGRGGFWGDPVRRTGLGSATSGG